MVPPSSHRVSRVRRYSGSSPSLSVFAYVVLTLFDRPSQAFRLTYSFRSSVLTPKVFLPPVCPLPISLATTFGISVDFSSSPYLDVSVQAVPLIYLCVQYMMLRLASERIAPFGHPRIDAFLRLPVAFRSLTRPSSAPNAKAFPLRSL